MIQLQLIKTFFYVLPFLLLMACDSDDDSSPNNIELITAHSWRVNTFDVQASTLGEPISDQLLAPFVDDILANLPLNGTITFEENTFTIEDQGTTIEGTWSLSADETEITMVLTALAETYTFEIKQITSESFDLVYTTTQNITLSTGALSIDVEATAFLVAT